MLFGIVVLAAVVTPIGDPITLGVLSGLLFVLYLAAVGIGASLVRRKRLARGDSAEPEEDDLDDRDEDADDDGPGDDPAPTKPGSDIRALD